MQYDGGSLITPHPLPIYPMSLLSTSHSVSLIQSRSPSPHLLTPFDQWGWGMIHTPYFDVHRKPIILVEFYIYHFFMNSQNPLRTAGNRTKAIGTVLVCFHSSPTSQDSRTLAHQPVPTDICSVPAAGGEPIRQTRYRPLGVSGGSYMT